jgi:hypothetical protein
MFHQAIYTLFLANDVDVTAMIYLPVTGFAIGFCDFFITSTLHGDSPLSCLCVFVVG